MRGMMVFALAAVATLGACQKTGEGEYQVETPDVDVSALTGQLNARGLNVAGIDRVILVCETKLRGGDLAADQVHPIR